MKIGPDKPDHSGEKAAQKGEAQADQKVARTSALAGKTTDPSMHRLSELADKTRRELVDKSGLQQSMKDKLLISRNRTAEIRQRIQAGYYGRPDVVRSIVDRIADYMEP